VYRQVFFPLETGSADMDFEREAAGIGALADPVRHQLYEFVCSQPAPVGRDQAADAVGIPHHQAKFHLDRLTAEGLLECAYARLTGRSGPGAGRTSKVYQRARRDIAVSLPQREYELAGQLMAAAIARSADTGEAVVEVLNAVAHECGQTIGGAAGTPDDAAAALKVMLGLLRRYGYEPRREDGEVELANCPFHALARTQTKLACHMNHAFITGISDALAPYGPDTCLEPRPARCCVVIKSAASAVTPGAHR
jgi:predicted ArsR family transcriptional regulator